MMGSSGKKQFFKLVIVFLTSILVAINVVSGPAMAASDSLRPKPQITEEKEGFFGGIHAGRVTIIDRTSYSKVTHPMSPSVVIRFQGAPIEADRVAIHSIIRLIIVDGTVQEIILIQEAS
jgi:hypothetical protein